MGGLSLKLKALALAGVLAVGFGLGVWVTRAFWDASETRKLQAENVVLQASLEAQKQRARRGVSLTLAMASVVASASSDWAEVLSDLAARSDDRNRQTEGIIRDMETEAARAGEPVRVPEWLCRAEALQLGRDDLSCASK